MAHLYKASEWQSGSGEYWYCGDVEDLGHHSGAWWIPARILGLTPADYIQWLIDNYHPDRITYSVEHNVLVFAWRDQSKMRKYKNYINAQSRKVNFRF